MRFFGFATPAALLLALFLTGCSDPGPAEEAGQSVDEAMEDARDTLEGIGEEPGPAEEAGAALDDMADDAQDGYEDLRDEMSD